MSDDELLIQFEACTLPYEMWTMHRTHLKVAHLYLKRYPFDDALERIRRGIKAYNLSKNIPEGPTMGYNETTTTAFTHLIAAVMQAYSAMFPTTTADEFCNTHPQLLTKHALRLFYSPERRLDPRAKTQFVEPDLAPLPKIKT